jgi:inorganic triphosphatase YgiF
MISSRTRCATSTTLKSRSPSNDAQLKQGFQTHLGETHGETKNHVARLEQIFKLRGQEATGVDCRAIDGIIEEAGDIRKTRRDLKPSFKTRVRRTVCPIRYDSGDIELNFDEGRIEAGRRSSRLYEAELELKRGDAQAMFRLARQIGKDAPATRSVKSKADRGYELLTGEAWRPVKAFSIKLNPKQSTQAAFRAIARACLHQLCAKIGP